jgi:methanogenic corrinoid protein MtbC1
MNDLPNNVKRVLMLMRTAMAVGIDPVDVVEKAVTKNIISLAEVDAIMYLFDCMVEEEAKRTPLSADAAAVTDLIDGVECYLKRQSQS